MGERVDMFAELGALRRKVKTLEEVASKVRILESQVEDLTSQTNDWRTEAQALQAGRAELHESMEDEREKRHAAVKRLEVAERETAALQKKAGSMQQSAKIDASARAGQVKRCRIMEHQLAEISHEAERQTQLRSEAEAHARELDRALNAERALRLQDIHRNFRTAGEARRAGTSQREAEKLMLREAARATRCVLAACCCRCCCRCSRCCCAAATPAPASATPRPTHCPAPPHHHPRYEAEAKALDSTVRAHERIEAAQTGESLAHQSELELLRRESMELRSQLTRRDDELLIERQAVAALDAETHRLRVTATDLAQTHTQRERPFTTSRGVPGARSAFASLRRTASAASMPPPSVVPFVSSASVGSSASTARDRMRRRDAADDALATVAAFADRPGSVAGGGAAYIGAVGTGAYTPLSPGARDGLVPAAPPSAQAGSAVRFDGGGRLAASPVKGSRQRAATSGRRRRPRPRPGGDSPGGGSVSTDARSGQGHETKGSMFVGSGLGLLKADNPCFSEIAGGSAKQTLALVLAKREAAEKAKLDNWRAQQAELQ